MHTRKLRARLNPFYASPVSLANQRGDYAAEPDRSGNRCQPGIGKEIALELARSGYRVAVNYYNEPASSVDATMAEIRALQALVENGALCIEADIRSGTGSGNV